MPIFVARHHGSLLIVICVGKGTKNAGGSGGPEFFYNFAKESMEKNGYVVLPLEDITEIRSSKQPDNHVIAIKHVAKTYSLLIVKGDYRTISVPTFHVPLLGRSSPPDFSKIKLQDLGLTVVFEDYSVDASVLLEGEDAAFLGRLKKSKKGSPLGNE